MLGQWVKLGTVPNSLRYCGEKGSLVVCAKERNHIWHMSPPHMLRHFSWIFDLSSYVELFIIVEKCQVSRISILRES